MGPNHRCLELSPLPGAEPPKVSHWGAGWPMVPLLCPVLRRCQWGAPGMGQWQKQGTNMNLGTWHSKPNTLGAADSALGQLPTKRSVWCRPAR